MAKKRRSYAPEFKQEAVRLVREEGMTYAKVGADLGVDQTLIRDWCKAQSRAPESTMITTPPLPLEEEVARLRRQVKILQEEREILKKAAAFFAKESR